MKRKDNNIVVYDDCAEIILRNRQEEEVGRAIIDLEDLSLIKEYKWYLNRVNNFVYADTGSNSLYIHRLLMNVVFDNNFYVDHVDRNRLNNKRLNLRVCSNIENCRNRGKKGDCSSEYIGISWVKDKKRWFSYIWIEYKRISLGKYKTIEGALIARLKAELKYFGEFAPQKHLFKLYNIGENKDE